MVERHGPASRYPLVADLAGVLAAAQQERAEDIWRFLTWLLRARWHSGRLVADKPLDSAVTVR